jgi:hypothetical protein
VWSHRTCSSLGSSWQDQACFSHSMETALINIREPLHQALSQRFKRLRTRIRPRRTPLGDDNRQLVGFVRQDIGLIGDCSPIPIFKPSVRSPL